VHGVASALWMFGGNCICRFGGERVSKCSVVVHMLGGQVVRVGWWLCLLYRIPLSFFLVLAFSILLSLSRFLFLAFSFSLSLSRFLFLAFSVFFPK